ncbi:hypothetical protein LTR37_019703, partial [Vermiconidia calcicola]
MRTKSEYQTLERTRKVVFGLKASIYRKLKLQRANPSDLPPYQYKKLEQNEFRLLVLLKGKGEERIRVEIEHANVIEEHHYAALSYVWGDPNKCHPVIIGDEGVHWATYNLWQALKRIRAEDEDRVLWVDAICINQKDDKEKEQQIQFMSRIYPQANRVLSWLGDDDGLVAEAFKELRRWSLAYGDEDRTFQLGMEVRTQSGNRRLDQSVVLGALFNRPYFRRAWCLPEVCTDSSKAPMLLCGAHELSWTRLVLGVLAMADVLTGDHIAMYAGANIIYVLPMLSLCWKAPEQRLLSNLIPYMEDREVTKPHDRIFALLGLAQG